MSQLLKRYLERKYIDRRDQLLASVFPSLAAHLRTQKVWNRLKNKTLYAEHAGQLNVIDIDLYTGDNAATRSIQKFLGKFKHPAIRAAIVQGSIATGEEIAFSDFDGILLIDRNKITSRKNMIQLETIVKESAHIMKKQDTLQHHGWSILFQQDLKRYPDAELPSLLLRQGKVIYPDAPLRLELVIDPRHQDYTILYENLCNGIYRRLNHPSTFKKYYPLKLLISECLLLPAAFLQAIEKTPVWKGDSFGKIAAQLEPQDVATLTKLSEIRQRWPEYYHGKSKRQPVAPELVAIFNGGLAEKIKDLIDHLDEKLEIQLKRIR